MYTNPQKQFDADVQALRKEAGETIQNLRQAQGLSQTELAAVLEVNQKTFISQLETGRRRVPPDKYEVTAKALNVEPREFVRMLMRYYDPVTYDILFGMDAEPALPQA